MKAKKNYRDSLFRNIFKDKRRLQSLYKALSGRDVPLKEIKINTLSGVFFNDIKNDISFRVGNRTVILMEHQSTWNPNMPLRMLWYIAKIYRREVTNDMPYRSTLVKIPTPEFYVFYNGTQKEPYKSQLRLSDAFMDASQSLELVVDTYNINYEADNPLLNRCYELRCYSIFVAKVRQELKTGATLMTAIKRAIRYCETHDLMKEYFTQNESEVFDMVNFKWDDQRAREVAQEELQMAKAEAAEAKKAAKAAAEEAKAAAKEAKTEGDKGARHEIALDMLKHKMPASLIAQISKLPLEQVEEIAKKNNLATV